MSTPVERPWIDAGYAAFALGGPDALKVEQLARQVGISKSSFYHHFADVPVFIERLLAHHLLRADVLASKAGACTSFDPAFIQHLVEHRVDLLFQRQLRMFRDNAAFQRCFQEAHERVAEQVMPRWAEALGISGQLGPAREMFQVVTDVFYQRLTNDNLSYPWMVELLKEIEAFIRHAMRSQGSISGLGTGQS
jgi:AcrR family transcriptional regulator